MRLKFQQYQKRAVLNDTETAETGYLRKLVSR